jgi:hypothetical protein
MKAWQHHEDFVLRNLCDMIINRDLLSIKLKSKPIKLDTLQKHKDKLIKKYDVSNDETDYFVFTGKVSNKAYDKDGGPINILFKNGRVKPIPNAFAELNTANLGQTITKHYICYPKNKL